MHGGFLPRRRFLLRHDEPEASICKTPRVVSQLPAADIRGPRLDGRIAREMAARGVSPQAGIVPL
jgi:hypothetical protein